jgi:hypothetical protein
LLIERGASPGQLDYLLGEVIELLLDLGTSVNVADQAERNGMDTLAQILRAARQA